MTAYNREWLEALWIKETSSEWHREGLLSAEKKSAIQTRFTANFYSPNVFIRIGLAIFCLILLMASLGLAALVLSVNSEAAFSMFSFFWGAACLFFLEAWAIKSARHRASGIDDMLVYCGITAMISAICYPMPYNTPGVVYCFVALPFLLYASIRYIDRLLAAAAYGCALMLVFFIVKDIPKLALYLLPLSGMLFSLGAYFFARRGQHRYEWRYWHGVFGIVEMLALATFYASGNYWVIQQAGSAMFELEQAPIPWFFWTFTFAVPIVYIVYGLRRGDRLLLDIGLACIGVAVFTFRYYIHVLPIAWASAIGGGVLFAVAYASIQYLRNNAGAYTYAEPSDTSLLQEIEEQLIEQTIANQPGETPDKKDSFGGGQFGGGGASGEF